MLTPNMDEQNQVPAVSKGAGTSKCTRCGRGIKNIFIVNGADYGPVCVKKVFGIDVTRGLHATPKASKQFIKNESQPEIFEELA